MPAERALALAPDELRRRQLAAFTSWVMAGARTQPAVLTLEDLHWADPTTLDLLRGIAERGALAPLFVMATARPEFALEGDVCLRDHLATPGQFRGRRARAGGVRIPNWVHSQL